ncbi:MAG: TadE/TadG family type IV pilus assembly protein [Phycisphaerae bacterium]
MRPQARQHAPARRRRRGSALVEFVFSVPLFATILALTFFFGYAMMNQQRVRSSDRYAVWRDVYRGGGNEPNAIRSRFFGEQAEGVEVHHRGGSGEARQGLVDEASSYSADAGEFTDHLVSRFPHGKWKRVRAAFPTDMPLWEQFSGKIQNHHARDTVEWRRRQASLSYTVRESYLRELMDALDNVNAPGDALSHEIENIIRNGW